MTYYPDNQGTFYFAAMAASLGRVIKAEGTALSNTAMEDLGQDLIDQAEASYVKGLDMIANYETYYSHINAINSDHFDAMVPIWTGTGPRNTAACHLYRATLDAGYLTAAQAAAAAPNNLVGFNARFQLLMAGENYTSAILSAGDGTLTREAICAWPTSTDISAALYNSWNPIINVYPLLYAWVASGKTNDAYLRCLLRCLNHTLGCNPQNLGWFSQFGTRWMTSKLDVDMTARGEGENNWPGMGVFGYNRWFEWVPAFQFGDGTDFWNFARTVVYRTHVGGNAHYRQPEPLPWQQPVFWYRLEDPGIVPLMEQGMPNTLDGGVAGLVLWDRYGKGVTAPNSRKRLITA
jgi:hypothetical protein